MSALLVATIAKALAQYEMQTRRDGGTVPDGFRQIAQAAVFCARTGIPVQEDPAPPAPCRLAHMDSLLMTHDQVALALAISPRKVKDLCASGVLPVVRIDGSTRVRRSDLAEYVASLGPRVVTKAGSGPMVGPP